MNNKNEVVIINLDRPRELRFGHKALKTLSAMMGKDLEDIDFDKFTLDELEKVMYCGLIKDAKSNNETLKLEDMEDILDCAPSYGEIIEKMQNAFSAAFGQFEGVEVDEKN